MPSQIKRSIFHQISILATKGLAGPVKKNQSIPRETAMKSSNSHVPRVKSTAMRSAIQTNHAFEKLVPSPAELAVMKTVMKEERGCERRLGKK